MSPLEAIPAGFSIGERPMFIRTAEDLARALDAPLDPVLHTILECYAGRLSCYPDHAFEELALIVIVEAGERLPEACPVQLGGGSTFSHFPEFVHHHAGWWEAVFILSDAGEGLVVLVQEGVLDKVSDKNLPESRKIHSRSRLVSSLSTPCCTSNLSSRKRFVRQYGLFAERSG